MISKTSDRTLFFLFFGKGVYFIFYPCSDEPYKKRKVASFVRPLLLHKQCLRFFLLDDLFAVVITAVRADTVREIEFSAVRALDHSGCCELPYVAASLIAASLGSFPLRYCHFNSSYVDLKRQNRILRLQPLYYTSIISNYQVVFAIF